MAQAASPATVQWISGHVLLDLGNGLSVDGRLTGDNKFQLTYPQYPDGEPEIGGPINTLTFTLAGLT